MAMINGTQCRLFDAIGILIQGGVDGTSFGKAAKVTLPDALVAYSKQRVSEAVMRHACRGFPGIIRAEGQPDSSGLTKVVVVIDYASTSWYKPEVFDRINAIVPIEQNGDTLTVHREGALPLADVGNLPPAPHTLLPQQVREAPPPDLTTRTTLVSAANAARKSLVDATAANAGQLHDRIQLVDNISSLRDRFKVERSEATWTQLEKAESGLRRFDLLARPPIDTAPLVEAHRLASAMLDALDRSCARYSALPYETDTPITFATLRRYHQQLAVAQIGSTPAWCTGGRGEGHVFLAFTPSELMTARQCYARYSRFDGFAVADGAGPQSFMVFLSLSRPITDHEACLLLGKLGPVSSWYTSGAFPRTMPAAYRELDGDILDPDDMLATLASSGRTEVAA